jgi:hypothetical protein
MNSDTTSVTSKIIQDLLCDPLSSTDRYLMSISINNPQYTSRLSLFIYRNSPSLNI